jgi:CheY-like chemotaxis protein
MTQQEYQFLVVDDNPNMPITINLLSNKHGLNAEILYFSNSIKALDYLKTHKCDLMFIDIEMSEISGFELLNQLTDPPFTVIMTNRSEKYAEMAFQFLGKNLLDFISKEHLIPYFERIKERFLNRDMNNQLVVYQNSETNDQVKIPMDKIKYFFKEKELIYVVLSDFPEKELFLKGTMESLISKLIEGTYFEARNGVVIMLSHVESYTLGSVSLGIDLYKKPILIKISYRKHRRFIKMLHRRHLLIPL